MATPYEIPTLSFATRAPLLTGLAARFEAAGLAGLRWIDLDVSRWRGATGPMSVVRACEASDVSVRAIWLPSSRQRLPWSHSAWRLATLTGQVVAATGAQDVVADRPIPGSAAEADRARLVRELRGNVAETVRLTLAIRPHELVGTREHLAELSVLRRQAEEWDFRLALDLDGPIDPRWESEAAVSKILPRLSVVRIGALESRPPGRGRARQTARVLAYLSDLGYDGVIAISAQAPFWRPDREMALARSSRDTAQAIVTRYDSLRRDLSSDAFRRYRQKL